MNITATLNGVSMIVVAAYLAAVIWNGNLRQLQTELLTEIGYLNFLVGLFLLYMVWKFQPTQGIVTMLVFGAVLAAVLKVASALNASDFNAFAAGQISIFDLINRVFGKVAQ